ncbi:MAG TPA: hypothetical protein VEL03_13225 [Streptosporangiaceae bacterium]|nr:hypothetical protein [Streptosporangiaceae bacterium]
MSIALRRRAGTTTSGWPGRRRWLILAVVVTLLACFGVATATLLVSPRQGMPARVDAIIMLNGPGGSSRLTTALDLAWAHRAPTVVISRGSQVYGFGGDCAPAIPGVRVICFVPSPPTTQGEAEFAGRLASRYHWKTVVLVTITPQITPGRIWLNRCMPGVTVYAVAAPLSARGWPVMVAYEWGAIANAELIHRSC